MVALINIYTVAIVAILYIFIRHIRARRKQPPGPLGLPYLGIFPFQLIQLFFSNFLPKSPPRQLFQQMKNKYGDIWSMETLGRRIIVLASYEHVHNAFVTHGKIFEGKERNEVFDKISRNNGIFLIDGPLWKSNRSTGVKALKDLGMGKSNLEHQICDEANLLIEHLLLNKTDSYNSSNIFIKPVSNVITRLLFNEFNQYNDPLLIKFIQNVRTGLTAPALLRKYTLFPKFFSSNLARLMFKDVDEYYKIWDDINGFVIDKCRKTESIQDQKAEPNCVFDYYWQSKRGSDETKEQKFNDIIMSMRDLYVGGTETTDSFLQFCCLMLGRYQDVQDDIRKEIQNLTDDYKTINLSLKSFCPKMLSFFDEIHRFLSLLPRFLHRTTKTCIFEGFTFEKGDVVICDTFSISRDDRYFDNPDRFDPYRFMNESRTQYVPSKNFPFFGIGSRACLGESVARMESFLILTRFVHTFHISLPENTLAKFDEILMGQEGFLYAPINYQMILKKI